MISKLLGRIMKNHGWKFVVNIPPVNKCVICVAPHTSNWDFIMGELASRSVGLKAKFLMKDTWFFFPLKYLLRALYIAKEAGVPIVLGYFNYDKKIVCLDRIFEPTDDVDADMHTIKRYYDTVDCEGKYPEKFTTGLNGDTK